VRDNGNDSERRQLSQSFPYSLPRIIGLSARRRHPDGAAIKTGWLAAPPAHRPTNEHGGGWRRSSEDLGPTGGHQGSSRAVCRVCARGRDTHSLGLHGASSPPRVGVVTRDWVAAGPSEVEGSVVVRGLMCIKVLEELKVYSGKLTFPRVGGGRHEHLFRLYSPWLPNKLWRVTSPFGPLNRPRRSACGRCRKVQCKLGLELRSHSATTRSRSQTRIQTHHADAPRLVWCPTVTLTETSLVTLAVPTPPYLRPFHRDPSRTARTHAAPGWE
jgi:hypothetical protein